MVIIEHNYYLYYSPREYTTELCNTVLNQYSLKQRSIIITISGFHLGKKNGQKEKLTDTGILVKEPIYQQLNKHLRLLINSGDFAVGRQFLTERAVSERFEVSRATANKALSGLVAEGLLEFRKGVGTFIRERNTDFSRVSLESFTKNVKAAGKIPSTTVLTFELIDSDKLTTEIFTALGLKKKKKVFHIRRLRHADKIPMILEERFLSASFFPDLSKADVEGSLFDLIENRYNLIVTGVEEKLEAVSLSSDEAKLLKIKKGMASLLITSIGYIRGTIPLWWERTFHRPDGFELRCKVVSNENGDSVGIQKITLKEEQ